MSNQTMENIKSGKGLEPISSDSSQNRSEERRVGKECRL